MRVHVRVCVRACLCACARQEGECHGPELQTGGWVAVPIGCCSPTQSVWACFNITGGTSTAGKNHVVNKPLWLLGDRLWHTEFRRCVVLQRSWGFTYYFVPKGDSFSGGRR